VVRRSTSLSHLTSTPRIKFRYGAFEDKSHRTASERHEFVPAHPSRMRSLESVLGEGASNRKPSPREMVGSSSGRALAAQYPALDGLEQLRKWRWQLLNPLRVYAMPATGLLSSSLDSPIDCAKERNTARNPYRRNWKRPCCRPRGLRVPVMLKARLDVFGLERLNGSSSSTVVTTRTALT